MSKFIGKEVIVRAKDAGVFFGTLKSREGNTVVLSNVRKIYYWDGACAVEELAVNGTSKPDNCKYTLLVEEMEIENPIQIIPCTEKAIESNKAVKIWKA